MNKSVMVGYKNFTGKNNGKDYTVVNVVSVYSKRELEKGCVGQKVEEVFVPDEMIGTLTPDLVGKAVNFEYELSGNRAYLVKMTFDK